MAPTLETDSAYVRDTSKLIEFQRPPEGVFLCHVSTNRRSVMLKPSKDVSNVIAPGARYAQLSLTRFTLNYRSSQHHGRSFHRKSFFAC